MASGGQATVSTCNDYSGSKVQSFFLKVRVTRYSIVTDCNYESSCWVHYWASNRARPFVRVRFWWSNQKKMQKLAEYSAIPVTFIYSCGHYGHHKQKRMIAFQFSLWYRIYLNLNQYNLIFISLWVIKNKILEWNWIKTYLTGGGGVDNGNVNWCMLGRALLCRTGHFCVQPGFFVSNHAFCCQTGLFCVERVL